MLLSLAAICYACQDEEPELGTFAPPSNVTLEADVTTDGSGVVTFRASAQNALTFHYFFGISDSEDPTVASSGEVTFSYPRTNTYIVRVVAFSAGGLSSTKVMEVFVEVDVTVPPELVDALTGGSSKRWVWNSTVAGHFGVGPTDTQTPDFFSASPNELPSDCLYDDVLIFGIDGSGALNYELVTNSTTFINWAEVTGLFPDATPVQFEDECRDIAGLLPTESIFTILTDEGTGIQTLELFGSFLSYFANIPNFEIVELSESRLSVRGIQSPPGGGELAWYFTFIPEDADPGGGGGGGEPTLIWADEFDVDGLPNLNNWAYDVGDGCPNLCGWGNNESQYYTAGDLDNARVEGGNLVIEVLKDDMGFDYTSARLKSIREFTGGRIEARIKLPAGQGTWSAFWLLGGEDALANYGIWPGRGELDIMEHIGRDPDRVFGTKHSLSGFAGAPGTGAGLDLPTATTEFHVYRIDWTQEKVEWFVDNQLYFTYENQNTGFEQWPYDRSSFIILNIAMGGNLGGTIDDTIFDNPVTMEVDYVRVYDLP